MKYVGGLCFECDKMLKGYANFCKVLLLKDIVVWLVFHVCAAEGNSLPDMPKLRYSDSYETAIMYQHLSLWDALSFTESVSYIQWQV